MQAFSSWSSQTTSCFFLSWVFALHGNFVYIVYKFSVLCLQLCPSSVVEEHCYTVCFMFYWLSNNNQDEMEGLERQGLERKDRRGRV
jgi:hypothetical protein